MNSPWTNRAAVACAGVLAEAGVRELTIESDGEVRVLRARVTDLPSLLISTPSATLRAGGVEIEWTAAAIGVRGEGRLATAIRDLLVTKKCEGPPELASSE